MLIIIQHEIKRKDVFGSRGSGLQGNLLGEGLFFRSRGGICLKGVVDSFLKGVGTSFLRDLGT